MGAVAGSSVLDLIGGTPLVTLARIHRGPVPIVAKAEFLQPGGSIKDRAAKAIIEAARADGRLRPGQPVVEMTSGNMGAGLAVVCAVLGHPFVATMSAGNSPQRARMLEALGAEVVLVPQVNGAPGQVTGPDLAAAVAVARRIERERGAFYVDQFANEDGPHAHEHHTGPEIWDQTGGKVSAFVACVGTGGTFVGIAASLKQRRADILCVAVEPAGCEVLAGKGIEKPRHLLQGVGYGVELPHWRPELMDLSLAVTDDEAERWRRRLAVEEGLHVGYSSAANVCAAARLVESGLCREGVVATLLCDTGLKY
jgi:cysteine synthase A